MNLLTTSPSATRRGHGALLLVVFIAMALIFILLYGSFGGGGSYTQQLGEARKQGRATVQDLNTRQLSLLITMYRDQNDRLPQNAEELENEAAFRDPWGGQITFTFEEQPSGQTVIIYRSNGPDGKPGTPDDVTQRDTLPY